MHSGKGGEKVVKRLRVVEAYHFRAHAQTLMLVMNQLVLSDGKIHRVPHRDARRIADVILRS